MKKIIYLLFFFLIPLNFSFASIENKIIANVENQIISSYELKNKIRTILILSNQKINQTSINNSKNQAIQLLINYKLKKNEILKYKVLEQKNATNNYINKISSQYNTDAEGLKKIFSTNNIDYAIYLDEIKTEFAWQNLMFGIYKDKININEKEIEKELKILVTQKSNIEEYNLSEISIILDDFNERDSKIKEIQSHIKSFGFENAAKKFSTSSTSFDGGNLGWISSKALSIKISQELNSLDVNNVSKPITQSDNVIFLKLNDKRVITTKDLDINKIRKDIINQKTNDSLNLYSNNHLSKIRNKAYIKIK